MEQLLALQIPWIQAVQAISNDHIIAIYHSLSFLSEEWFLLLFIPFIVWSVDYRFGVRLMVLLLVGVILNWFLKELGHQPRPFMFDDRIIDSATFEGFALPSGHSQTAVIVWGYLAARFNKAWGWVLALSIILLVGLSRIGLGMHFPTDIVGGWIVGGLMLFTAVKYGDAIGDFLNRLYLPLNYVLGFSVPVVFAMLQPIGFFVGVCGVFSGIWIGALLTHNFDGVTSFCPRNILYYFIGVAGLLVLFIGLKRIFPGVESDHYLLFKYIRYDVVGLWICLFGPLIAKIKSK